MWASTRCPLSSSTRNIAFGRASATVPSTSMASLFLAIYSAFVVFRAGIVFDTVGRTWTAPFDAVVPHPTRHVTPFAARAVACLPVAVLTLRRRWVVCPGARDQRRTARDRWLPRRGL